jgi:hypothetical protein
LSKVLAYFSLLLNNSSITVMRVSSRTGFRLQPSAWQGVTSSALVGEYALHIER